MKKQIPIEEQVAQLTPEQQRKILKVGPIALTLMLIVEIPWIFFLIVGLFTMIDPPAGYEFSEIYKGFWIFLLLGLLYVWGILLFVKIKYPFYSDAKWQYLNKLRKANRK